MRTIVTATIVSLALVSAAAAHPATEQYIPIGQSPGPGIVSGRAGPVAEPSEAGGEPIVSVQAASGNELGAYAVTPQTRVYIDRSTLGLPNLVGTIDDVQPGRVIEVRIADPETRAAEWIKVRP